MSLHYDTIQYVSKMTGCYSPLRLHQRKKVNSKTLLFSCKIFTCINRTATRPCVKRIGFIKGAVSRNSAKLGNFKMPVKLRET